jgi:hypothetical protein
VAAWYCLVDAVALGGAGPLLNGMTALRGKLKWSKARKTALEGAGNDQ